MQVDAAIPDRMGILYFANTGGGRVMPLQGDMAGSFRLRLGHYRVLFTREGDSMPSSA
jgi:hypothetical protein